MNAPRVIVKEDTDPKTCIRTIGRCVYKVRGPPRADGSPAPPRCVFVPDPSLRGRWLMTDLSVIEVACPTCHSVEGVPCLASTPHAKRAYSCTTHCARRRALEIQRHQTRVPVARPTVPWGLLRPIVEAGEPTMRSTVVKPGKNPRQMLRDDLARARRIVRSIRHDLRQRSDFYGGALNLPPWELAHFRDRERDANKQVARILARLDKMD